MGCVPRARLSRVWTDAGSGGTETASDLARIARCCLTQDSKGRPPRMFFSSSGWNELSSAAAWKGSMPSSRPSPSTRQASKRHSPECRARHSRRIWFAWKSSASLKTRFRADRQPSAQTVSPNSTDRGRHPRAFGRHALRRASGRSRPIIADFEPAIRGLRRRRAVHWAVIASPIETRRTVKRRGTQALKRLGILPSTPINMILTAHLN